MEPTSGHWKKDVDLDSILKPFGIPGAPWGLLVGAIFALAPPRGALEEPKEPILSHLGRVPFWTLILEPKNHKKNSISKVPEP